MSQLKGVIFSLRDVLTPRGPIDKDLFAETIRLLKFLKSRDIVPVFATNHQWVAKSKDKSIPFQNLLEELVGEVPFYIAERGDIDWKPRAGAVAGILDKQGWSRREVLYVGNSEDDMRTARNGKVLFLNALWHGEASPYGFQFGSAKDVARFIDCICLGLNSWFWAIEDNGLRVYALAPFTTLSPQYAAAHAYSAGARATAKDGADDAGFWGRLLAARTYFSGLVDEIQYVTAYPGHSTGSAQPVIADALSILAESLHRQFLPDLIIRHTTAVKSQTARRTGAAVGVNNQLNTIRLNKLPSKGIGGQAYKSNPLSGSKTVLVVDDFCTQGNSFEAARLYIEKAGAKSISLSWLKTINSDYNVVSGANPIVNPYSPNTITKSLPSTSQWYSSNIVDKSAATDLATVYKRYYNWDWPKDI